VGGGGVRFIKSNAPCAFLKEVIVQLQVDKIIFHIVLHI